MTVDSRHLKSLAYELFRFMSKLGFSGAKTYNNNEYEIYSDAYDPRRISAKRMKDGITVMVSADKNVLWSGEDRDFTQLWKIITNYDDTVSTLFDELTTVRRKTNG